MKKLMKKLGYGYNLTWNEYSKLFIVYKFGDWNTSISIDESKTSSHKNPKRAIKKYLKKYCKK